MVVRTFSITFAALALTASVAVNAEPTLNYQDAWWNPRTALGMGWNLYQQGEIITISWFHYGNDGADSWRTMASELKDGRILQGEMFQCFGTPPGPSYDPAAQGCENDGTFRMEFFPEGDARFSYESHALGNYAYDLERYTFRYEDFTDDYLSTSLVTAKGCNNPVNNGSWVDVAFSSIENIDGKSWQMIEESLDGTICIYNLTLDQHGSVSTGNGNFNCDNGLSGNLNVDSMRLIDGSVSILFTGRSNDGCSLEGQSSNIAIDWSEVDF